MASILPFRGILYNREKIRDLSCVVAPPYDVISEEAQERYYEISEYNVIRLILGKDFPGDNQANNRYTRAARFFQRWFEEGILVRDISPSIYLLEEEYKLRGEVLREVEDSPGKEKLIKRSGFIALLKLEDFSRGIVRPHEGTMAEPKKDRLNLLRACKANFSQIFVSYEDQEKTIDRLYERKTNQPPEIDLIDGENIRHKLWRIDSQEAISAIVEGMRDKKLFIADGHHRYESALEFRNELRKSNPRHTGHEGYNYVMSYFVNMENSGLRIFAIHRAIRNFEGFDRKKLVTGLREYFEIEMFTELEELLVQMQERKEGHQIGMCTGEKEFYLLSLRGREVPERLIKGKEGLFRRLDVAILHNLIIEKILRISPESQEVIAYSEKVSETVAKVRKGSHCVAFFLKPVRVSEFKAIVDAGEIMPKKSTYFYPKLLSGLIINKIDFPVHV